MDAMPDGLLVALTSLGMLLLAALGLLVKLLSQQAMNTSKSQRLETRLDWIETAHGDLTKEVATSHGELKTEIATSRAEVAMYGRMLERLQDKINGHTRK